MTKRETRVIDAFIHCVRSGEFTEDYAIVLIENNRAYGWLSDAAKEVFYAELDTIAAEKERERMVEEAVGNQVEKEQVAEVETVETDVETTEAAADELTDPVE